MADITKAVAGRTVTYSAASPRADAWMQQRVGQHTITFDTSDRGGQADARAFEAAANALNPPLRFEDV